MGREPQVLRVGNIAISNRHPMVLVGGVNVLESRSMALETAAAFKEACGKLGIPCIFKASFDKANRSALSSYRGPGLDKGLAMLADIKESLDLPVLTDVHEPAQALPVAEVADVLQLPAFLSRQTDLVLAMAATGAAINVKKAQFLAPAEMRHILEKFHSAGNEKVMLCERGTSFGYNNLVVDMLGFSVMKQFGCPLLFDVTHALQLPGGLPGGAGGRRAHVAALAKAGISQKIAGLFLEAHPHPERAPCDGPCALRLDRLEDVLGQVKAVDDLVKSQPGIDTA